MNVMVTGTRHKRLITMEAATTLFCLVDELDETFNIDKWIHGGCTGADAMFHGLVEGRGEIHVYPAKDVDIRWKAKLEGVYVLHPEEKPLVRNRKMVDQSDISIVVPPSNRKVPAGGTGSTYRYARDQSNVLYVIHPDGEVGETWQ